MNSIPVASETNTNRHRPATVTAYHKVRYSERAPPLPFGNGRALPSKWEDAEKWILPISHSQHRRPKSKSGPLRPLSSAASPFHASSSASSTGGLAADRSNGVGVVRSASIHGWSDNMIEPSVSSLPSSHGAIISRTDLRKDVAIQMSPNGSPRSSPSPPSAHRVEETEGHFSKLDIRDVQMDDRRATARGSEERSTNIIGQKTETEETEAAVASRWEVAETAKSISRYKREEARIMAWEDLQKAKAEAEIRKLEMKLEKKRFSSMDRILSKLRSAQRKAREMRSAVTANQAEQIVGITKRSSYFRRTGRNGASGGCFTCRAF